MLELYPYQRRGADFLRVAGSALVGDEMGTGKTPMTVVALDEQEAFPALIIAPNSVKHGWAREFARWAPRRRVRVAPAGTKQAEAEINAVAAGAADVLIVNWEALKNLSKLAHYGGAGRLQTCSNCDPTSTRAPRLCQREDKALNLVRWVAVVADEAHRAKNPKANQTRALWAVGDRADRRIALTGSPVANSPEDLWSVMRFVAPDEWPSKTSWVNRYCILTPNYYSGGNDIAGIRTDRREELDKYFQPRFIRRLKSEVLPDLPPKVYEQRDVAMSPKQAKAYKEMRDEMMTLIDGGILTETTALTAAIRLRQFASASAELKRTWTEDGDVDEAVRLTEPSSKLDVLYEVLEELGDRQAVIFAESKQLLGLVADRFTTSEFRYGMITGDIPEEVRHANVERFRRGEISYMLVTIGAGAEGLDGLQTADTAIFLQRPWSAVLNQQAEDRLHRNGQEGNKVTYIDLVTTDTVEEEMALARQRKQEMQAEVLGTK